jgi:riboflavin kinase
MATASTDSSAPAPKAFNWDHLYATTERDYDASLLLQAPVVAGFQRGSKELGIPTANLDMDVLGDTGSNLETGIYFGWAKLKGKHYECVVSVGWNPFYKNEKKTIEAHLLETMDDFYGEQLDVLLCGYLRQECNFAGLEDLISCINNDILKTRQHNEQNERKESDASFWSLHIPASCI